MKLSIIMRTWNRLEYTIQSIKSIYNHSGLKPDDYEIICVDQNSTDGTREWLKAAKEDGYYPIRTLFLDKNFGDGLGMMAGIDYSLGEYIAQHDNDIEIVMKGYYQGLIAMYELMEEQGLDPCAIGGSHYQGINMKAAPIRFAEKRYDRVDQNVPWTDNITQTTHPLRVVYSAWVTASFIFKRRFIEKDFDKGMCNSWCGYWWDKGFNNALCPDINFWHIDSAKEGGEHVELQAKKFPNYKYIQKHYKNFI